MNRLSKAQKELLIAMNVWVVTFFFVFSSNKSRWPEGHLTTDKVETLLSTFHLKPKEVRQLSKYRAD